MQTLHQTIPHHYQSTNHGQGMATKFMNWCTGQQENRIAWLAIILAVHGCILVPVTMLAIFAYGVNIVLCSITLGAMAMALVPNLAALPTRITIPVFVLSILADVVVITVCIAGMLN
jgi:hypothetical protein